MSSPARVRRLSVDADQPPDDVDLGEADRWRVLLTRGGTPVDYFSLPSPGHAGDPAAVVDEAILRRAYPARSYDRFLERFRARMGLEDDFHVQPSCSVVVCTHRRSRYLPDLLAALGRLDPAADEVIVVDNDPGDQDSREVVEAAGARYVREDRRGLDTARTTGLAAARHEIVAFTDDDCIPVDGWLRNLGELFSDATVGAVTGPAYAFSLDTASQVRFEESGGFGRGLRRRRYDWTGLAPVHAGQTGAGANMLFRRELLEGLGGVFPCELDAGTATESGGDAYALYKVLAGGHRVVYDPGTRVFHQHRESAEAMHKAFVGYGVGLSATLLKLLVEEGEVDAPRAWWWLVRQYLEVLARRAMGRADTVDVRIGWDYLRGGLLGPQAWRRARRESRPDVEARPLEAAPTSPPSEGVRGAAAAGRDVSLELADSPGLGARLAERVNPVAAGERPACEVSVVIPTVGRPQALSRCLSALAREGSTAAFEVLVLDDSSSSGGALPDGAPAGLSVREIVTGGRGAAAARNAGAAAARGEVLLFLDDDLVVRSGAVDRHLNHHRESSDRIVIGYSPPRPPARDLMAMTASLWWEDHFRAKRGGAALTFVHVLTGNMSLRRETFERFGGFDEEFARFRREDWEWGIRVLGGGAEVVYEPAAVADHEFSLDPRQFLAAAHAEGSGDALILRRHPIAARSLPVRRSLVQQLRRPLRTVALRALRSTFLRGAGLRVLDLLEVAKARRSWLRLVRALRQGAYEQGFRGVWRGRRPRAETPALSIELNADTAIPRPRVAAPTVRFTLDGRRLAEVRPPDGYWDSSLADLAAASVPWTEWRRLGLGEMAGDSAGRDGGAAGERATVVWSAASADGRAALERAGAHVIARPAGDLGWEALDRIVRDAATALVLVPLPGVAVDAGWYRAALTALAGDRVALAVGTALDDGEPDAPLSLHSRRSVPARFGFPGAAAQWVGFRTAAYRTLGGIDGRLAALGPQGPILDLVERAMDAGFVVARRDGHGVRPAGPLWRLRGEAARERARSGLALRNARRVGGLAGSYAFTVDRLAPLAYESLRAARGRGPSAVDVLVGWLGLLDGCRAALGVPPSTPDADAAAAPQLPTVQR